MDKLSQMTTCKVELSGARMTQQEADRRARVGTEADNLGEKKKQQIYLDTARLAGTES